MTLVFSVPISAPFPLIPSSMDTDKTVSVKPTPAIILGSSFKDFRFFFDFEIEIGLNLSRTELEFRDSKGAF